MGELKYVMTNEGQFIIFPIEMDHNKFIDFNLKNAGFIKIIDGMFICYGESKTLNIKSGGDDDSLLITKEYGTPIALNELGSLTNLKGTNSLEKQFNLIPGEYEGLWSAYNVNVLFDNGCKSKNIEVNEGVRGINCDCNVEVNKIGNVNIL